MTQKLFSLTDCLTHEAQTAQKGTMKPHDKDRAGTGPFRFKRKHLESDGDYGEEQNDSRKGHRHHHRRHHDSRRRRKSSSEHGYARVKDHSHDSLPPDVAFQESLFDALGDDEGAEYWVSFLIGPSWLDLASKSAGLTAFIYLF